MKAVTLLVALLALPALADPFPKADPRAGRELADKAKCTSCHSAMFGGDGSRIYTRPDRKVKNAQGLATQVRFCATQLNTGWFPDDEEHVAKYLNETYYKFK